MNKEIEKLEMVLKQIEELKQYSKDNEIFIKWKEQCKFAIELNFEKNSDEYKNFKSISFFSMVSVSDKNRNKILEETAYNRGLKNAKARLEVMIEKLQYKHELKNQKKINNNVDRIFISHANDDKEYTDLLVALLHNIGIEKSSQKIFYTSKQGYGIPLKKNIYDYLKKELNENILVIFVLSNSYYKSPACLNEMGATWVNSKKNITILLPYFEFKEIKGAIDPMEISFKVTDKYRLNEFKDMIIKLFNLKKINSTIWEQDRDKFLSEVKKLIERDKIKHLSSKEEIKSVRRGKECSMDIDVMISNLDNTDLICQEMTLNLMDKDKNETSVELNDEQLDNLIICVQERRKITFKLKNENSKFNPRRFKEGKIISSWAKM